MVNARVTSRLLAMPIIWMGVVQLIFAMLSIFLFADGIAIKFLIPATAMLAFGIILFFAFKSVNLSKATYRDALIYATATWIIAGILGSLPIMNVAHISFTEAVFESTSALTTTGATVLTGLDAMPKTFLLYRQFLQWMGGLGIVIFVVAILPMLNVGGMKLLKAETPGPIKDDKLSPRVANTAHYLWGVYILITAACALFYYLGGMSFYDAIAHSFSTVSTGGFSTHDASMWHFESHSLLMISNVFMLLGAINFGLHFKVMYKRNLKGYVQDEETRVFIKIVVTLSLLLATYLFFTSIYTNAFESISFSLFHIISFITSTGFGAADVNHWPLAAGFLLVFTGYLGGCAGSTAGGNKIIRNIITLKIINHQIKQLAHPRSLFQIKYQDQLVSSDVRGAVMAFMSFAAGTSFVLTLMLMATGLDFWSAFSAVAACVNVLGPGFGQVGSNFAPVNDAGTWILSGAMILGRLEYFTVFALLSIRFWRT
jgi:trk system potassium uptake protein TrkH